MKYAEIKSHDIANGPGIRVSVFASGCNHACPGCFNAEARDFNYGQEFTQKTIDHVIELMKPNYISGLTLLGGEPFAPENQQMMRELVRKVRQVYPKKSVRAFSGFTYEFMETYMVPRLPYTDWLLQSIDVLVDGKRKEDLKSLNLRFRGSSNQRLIDLRRTRKIGQIVRAFGEVEREKFIQARLISPEDINTRETQIINEAKPEFEYILS
ncbi:hypothetical protein AGMMS50249_0060 [candidate division SR1 bacterium]|nr:hypothetical protein AGMMS50249_0060 [candidate division SR1 bacterium]